jgi:hypothetical protein
MSPGFWLHHAALAADLDEEMFGPGGDLLRETPQNIAARARAAS